MAVQGYATIQSKSSGNQLHTLMVFDGWNEYVRYLNLDFGNWTDLRGKSFNGKKKETTYSNICINIKRNCCDIHT